MPFYFSKEYRKPAILLAVGLMPAIVLVVWPDHGGPRGASAASTQRVIDIDVASQGTPVMDHRGPTPQNLDQLSYHFNTPKAMIRSLAMAHRVGDLGTLLSMHDFDRMAQLELEQVMPAEAINESLIDETVSAMQRGYNQTFVAGEHALTHAEADRIRVIPNDPMPGVFRVIVPCGEDETNIEVLMVAHNRGYKIVGIHTWAAGQ